MQLNILDNLIKQWYNGVGWEMVDCMCKLQVLKKNQNVMLEGRFVSLNANEVTAIDN
jgi:hypothetical protein